MFYYDVYPKVVPADEVSVIRIRPRFAHAAFPENATVSVSHVFYDRTSAPAEPEWKIEEGVLVIKDKFVVDFLHLVRITHLDAHC